MKNVPQLPDMTKDESAWVYAALADVRGNALGESERGILQGLLEGKSLKDISTELFCNYDHVRGTASSLYQCFEKWTGIQDIDKKTIRPAIEGRLKLREIPNPVVLFSKGWGIVSPTNNATSPQLSVCCSDE